MGKHHRDSWSLIVPLHKVSHSECDDVRDGNFIGANGVFGEAAEGDQRQDDKDADQRKRGAVECQNSKVINTLRVELIIDYRLSISTNIGFKLATIMTKVLRYNLLFVCSVLKFKNDNLYFNHFGSVTVDNTYLSFEPVEEGYLLNSKTVKIVWLDMSPGLELL